MVVGSLLGVDWMATGFSLFLFFFCLFVVVIVVIVVVVTSTDVACTALRFVDLIHGLKLLHPLSVSFYNSFNLFDVWVSLHPGFFDEFVNVSVCVFVQCDFLWLRKRSFIVFSKGHSFLLFLKDELVFAVI